MKRRLFLSCNSLLLAVALAALPLNASALPVAGGATYGTPGNNGPDLKLGPTNSQTCFLRGVSGSLHGNPHVSGLPNSLLAASAEVLMSNGFWWVRTRAGAGTGVTAHVMCIFATANRVEFSWGNNHTTQGVPGTSKRRCFLRRVWATSGMGGQGDQRTNLTIRKDGNEFNMNGSHVHNVAGDSDWGGATAVCVDVAATGLWGFTFTGPTNAANSATATHTIRSSYPNGAPVPVANVGCGLTAISGKWINPVNDALGWYDGAYLVGDLNVSPNWRMTVTNGRQASGMCLM